MNGARELSVVNREFDSTRNNPCCLSLLAFKLYSVTKRMFCFLLFIYLLNVLKEFKCFVSCLILHPVGEGTVHPLHIRLAASVLKTNLLM